MKLRHSDFPIPPEEAVWRARISEICLQLPDAVVTIEGREDEHAAFRVREKIFAYYLLHHHNDGRIAIWCKGQPGIQQSLVGSHPDRFFVPPYVGPKGWIGIRLDGVSIDWEEVEDLVEMSYRKTATKAQIARLETGETSGL